MRRLLATSSSLACVEAVASKIVEAFRLRLLIVKNSLCLEARKHLSQNMYGMISLHAETYMALMLSTHSHECILASCLHQNITLNKLLYVFSFISLGFKRFVLALELPSVKCEVTLCSASVTLALELQLQNFHLQKLIFKTLA